MNGKVIPPCYNHAINWISQWLARQTFPFTGSDASSVEGESVIDDDASTNSLVRNTTIVPDVTVAVRVKAECFHELPDLLGGEEGALSRQECGGEGDNEDSFVDIKSGITANGGGESEGWTFAETLAPANLSMETSA